MDPLWGRTLQVGVEGLEPPDPSPCKRNTPANRGWACSDYVVEGLAGTVVDVVLVVDVVVVLVEVVVVVVVGGGITKPFAHPHRMSMGAPTGVPNAPGMASMARRS